MDTIMKNDMYRELVISSLTADLRDSGYTVSFPSRDGADCVVSKPGERPFAVEFRSYKDLRYFFDSAFAKGKRRTQLLGKEIPVFYVGVDSQIERVAVEQSLAKKLGAYTSRLNLKEYAAA